MWSVRKENTLKSSTPPLPHWMKCCKTVGMCTKQTRNDAYALLPLGWGSGCRRDEAMESVSFEMVAAVCWWVFVMAHLAFLYVRD